MYFWVSALWRPEGLAAVGTVAAVTNLDRDDTETSVGAAMEAAADLEEPGNAAEAQLAESEDVEGSDARRPAPEEIRRRETPRATDQARAEGRGPSS